MVIHLYLYLLIYVAITYYIDKTLLTNNFLLEQNGYWMVWLVFLLRYLSSVSLGITRHGIGASRLVFLQKAHIMHFVTTVVYDLMGSLRFVLLYFKMKLNLFILVFQT
jgi:hypothetical protein